MAISKLHVFVLCHFMVFAVFCATAQKTMDTALSAFDGHEFSISESYQRLIDGHADVFYPMFYGFISRDMITYLFMPPRMLMFLFLKFGVITMMAIRI